MEFCIYNHPGYHSKANTFYSISLYYVHSQYKIYDDRVNNDQKNWQIDCSLPNSPKFLQPKCFIIRTVSGYRLVENCIHPTPYVSSLKYVRTYVRT